MPLRLNDDQQERFDALPATAAVIDEHGVIRAVNDRWRHFSEANGLPDGTGGVGQRYVVWEGGVDVRADEVTAGMAAVAAGTADSYSQVYPCHSETQRRWFEFVVVPVTPDPPRALLAVHVELVESEHTSDGALDELADMASGWVAERVTLCAWCAVREQTDVGDWRPLSAGSRRYRWQSHGICDECITAFDVASAVS